MSQRFLLAIGRDAMSLQDQVLDDDLFDAYDPVGWPALGWIVLSALVTVIAFLVAPLP
jgi:hypothetical protein